MESTLPQTLASLEGFPNPRVFVDENGNAWRNWLAALSDLSRESVDAVLLAQDDVLFCKGLRDFLDRELWPSPNTGVVSLYCPGHLTKESETGFTRHQGMKTWGACALVFPVEVARAIVAHEYTQRWKHSCRIDMFVGKIKRRLEKEWWYATPSLAQHIGVESTLNHGGNQSRKMHALDFIGADAFPHWPQVQRYHADGRPREIPPKSGLVE